MSHIIKAQKGKTFLKYHQNFSCNIHLINKHKNYSIFFKKSSVSTERETFLNELSLCEYALFQRQI
jgi:hypothetical protein